MADLVRAAALGFESSQTPRVNALGQFIKNMLAMHQQKEVIGAQAIGEMGVAKYKQGLEEASPLFQKKLGLIEAQTEVYKARATTKGISDIQKFKLQVWKQADAEAFKEAGGSLMVGIGTKKEIYKQRRKQLYEQYLKEFDISDLGEPNIMGSIIPQEETSLIDYEW